MFRLTGFQQFANFGNPETHSLIVGIGLRDRSTAITRHALATRFARIIVTASQFPQDRYVRRPATPHLLSIPTSTVWPNPHCSD